MAVLSKCNPESTLACEAWSETLLVNDARPGTHETRSAAESLVLTAAGEDLLGALRNRPRSME